MKRITKLATLMFITLASVVSLTSCDEIIADTLEGTWEGNMYISSSYDGRSYNSTYSEIEFSLDPFRFTKGSGYWVDYYSDAPWDYIANHIEWRVDNKVITVYFVEEGTTIHISDYHLDDDHFIGWIDDNGTPVQFDLIHTSSPNWDNYTWYDDDYYYDYYAKKGGTFDSTSCAKGVTNDSTKVERPHRFVRSK